MPADTSWPIERPLYDVRFDAYWLVTKEAHQYRFVGPVMLSPGLLGMLPGMSADERRDALRHAPRVGGEVEARVYLSPIKQESVFDTETMGF